MKSRKTRTLTRAEVRALAVTPGLIARRVGPDGRARRITSTRGGG
jgi:hypothetical protein